MSDDDLKDIQAKPNYSHDMADRKAFLLKSSVEPLSVAISLIELIYKIQNSLMVFYKTTGLQGVVQEDIKIAIEEYKLTVDEELNKLKDRDTELQNGITENAGDIDELQKDLKELEDRLTDELDTIYAFISAITDNKSIDETKLNSLPKLRDAITALDEKLALWILTIQKHEALLVDLTEPVAKSLADIKTDIFNIKNKINELVISVDKLEDDVIEINKRLDDLESKVRLYDVNFNDKYSKEYVKGDVFKILDTGNIVLQIVDLGEAFENLTYKELIDQGYMVILGVRGVTTSNVLACGTF